jgi:hypothetical protein
MIELRDNGLLFSFPEVHPEARMTINFQRTLRIPDDGNDYPLPPGLGSFPLHHIDDYTGQVPAAWLTHGGVMLPMHQSEAMWISFDSGYIEEHGTSYPFAVKIAAGKINAVTGKQWQNQLAADPQDYLVLPDQPWLDGFCVKKGIIRQFVAMPLGKGYTAEEQLTGAAEHGGLQIIVCPMRREVFERRFPKTVNMRVSDTEDCVPYLSACHSGMGLAPGGKMRQEIYEDPFAVEEWDQTQSSRCFTHMLNSLMWRAITGQAPPTLPPTAEYYTSMDMPWFDYYDDAASAVSGSEQLARLKSVLQLGMDKGEKPLPDNGSITPGQIMEIRRVLRKNQIREGSF